MIQRSDGRPKTVDGLFVVEQPPDPSLCPSCGARRGHFEGGEECRAISELREMGATLSWQRVPYGYGRAIGSGPVAWETFLNNADYPSRVAATRHAREWIALTAQTRKEPATA